MIHWLLSQGERIFWAAPIAFGILGLVMIWLALMRQGD